MPPRALRKLQRQQEQERLAALEKPGEDVDDESEEDVQPVAKQQKSAFALLGEPAEDEEQDTEEAEEQVHHEAHTSGDNVKTARQDEAATTQPKAKKKKKAKKNKAKAKDSATPQDPVGTKDEREDLDDIDRALQELRVKDGGRGTESASMSLPSELGQFYLLLSVDSKNLKVLNEMKRLFGSSVLEGENEGGTGAQRRRGRGPQQLDLGAALDRRNNPLSRGQGLSERILRKNIFIQGKDSWVKETGGGLGMEVVEQAEDFTTEYRYVHSMTYRRSQQEFNICVDAMDPQRMIYFLQMNPYHISGLLQVAEIARQHQEPAVAVDLVERALFSFGRAAHSSFSTAISEGKARMDFRRPENRELWLAGWRYVRGLGQRGTWRTAFEWAKLLFSLDPEGDPYQIRLEIDQLAIRAGQFEQLVRLANTKKSVIDWGQDQANVRISLALAHDRLKHPTEARSVLADAVQKWPWIIARLLRELDIDRIPKSVWGKEPRTPREELHTSAYVTRAKDLWNTPEAVSLLVEVAETTDALVSPPAPDMAVIDVNEARHFMVDETPALLGLLPRVFTSAHISASDPLPPEDNLASYTASGQDITADSESDDATDSEDGSGAEAAEQTGWWGWTNRVLGAFGRGSGAEGNAGTEESEDGGGGEGSATARDTARPQNRDAASRRRQQAVLAHEEQVLAEQDDAMLAEAIRQSQMEHEAAMAQSAQATTASEPAQATTSSAIDESPPAAAPAAQQQQQPAANDNDPQRIQRFLAGSGLIALKSFCTEHGASEDDWGFGLADERAAPVREYVAKAKALPAHQRRFILDYALPQGAGKEAGDLIQRLV